jgi:hypothetical protein
MKILITTHHLKNREGSELFTINLAKELKKRQHEIFVFSPILGTVAEELKESKISVFDNLMDLASQKFDLIHAQHNTTAILARSIFPTTPIVITLHGILPDLEQPPSIDLGIEKYLVVSEEIQVNLIQKYSIDKEKIEIVRNFIDNEKYSPTSKINQQAKNLLVISNRSTVKERNIILAACQELDLNYQHIGLPDNPVINVNDYINQADIVITLGRGSLEAMSCARNVIIFDIHGGDGFIDEKSFYEIRKNNFSGRRYGHQYSKIDLVNEIKKYNPSLGKTLREIVNKENSTQTIINQLEKIYQIASRQKTISSQITKNQLYREINYLEKECKLLLDQQTNNFLTITNNNLASKEKEFKNPRTYSILKRPKTTE